jgi:septal ring factor EnvC (AmiA/AmiB activator)
MPEAKSSRFHLARALICAAAIAAGSGCSLSPGRQLSSCQEEKQKLLDRIEQDQHRLQALAASERQAAERLAQAEKELALIHDGRSRSERLAARPDEPLVDRREQDVPQPLPIESGPVTLAPPAQSTSPANGWAPRDSASAPTR